MSLFKDSSIVDLGGFNEFDFSGELFSRELQFNEADINSWDNRSFLDSWKGDGWKGDDWKGDDWKGDDGDEIETALLDIPNECNDSPRYVYLGASACPPLAPEAPKDPETNSSPKEHPKHPPPFLLLKRPTKPLKEPTRVQPRRAAAERGISYTEEGVICDERLLGEKHPRDDEESPPSSPKFAYAEGGLFSNGNATKKTKRGKEKKKDPTRYTRGCESAIWRWECIPDDAKENFDDGHGSVWVCSQPIGRHLGIDPNDWAFLGVAYSLYESVILEMNAKKAPTNINHWTRFGAFLHKFFDRKRGKIRQLIGG